VWTWENVLESPYKGQFYWSVMLDGREPVGKETLAVIRNPQPRLFLLCG
jgi:hypothetical protein